MDRHKDISLQTMMMLSNSIDQRNYRQNNNYIYCPRNKAGGLIGYQYRFAELTRIFNLIQDKISDIEA